VVSALRARDKNGGRRRLTPKKAGRGERGFMPAPVSGFLFAEGYMYAEQNARLFGSASDGCIYFWDKAMRRFRKICDIDDPDELPQDVKSQIRAAREEAAEILAIPSI
jgi:hypothetical protein